MVIFHGGCKLDKNAKAKGAVCDGGEIIRCLIRSVPTKNECGAGIFFVERRPIGIPTLEDKILQRAVVMRPRLSFL